MKVLVHAPHLALAQPFSQGDNPFLLDCEGLRAQVGLGELRRGMALFKRRYVICASVTGWGARSVLCAEVARERGVVDVRIAADGQGVLHATCECAVFHDGRLCEHAAAALLHYGETMQLRPSENDSPRQGELALRERGGWREVTVRHLSGSEDAGTWSAQSVLSTAAALRPYTVQMRHLTEPLNLCNCPDFAVNRLGTCKHIEAVLYQLRRRGAVPTRQAMALVGLDWQDLQTPLVRVHRFGSLAPAVEALLARHFDGEGRLRESLPAAWEALQVDALQLDPQAASELSLGDDARNWALRCAEQEARRVRKAKIEAELLACGGKPDWLQGQLFPYQCKGVATLAGHGRALLADEMGLGKTLQAIAAARWLMDHEGVRRVLILCPASLKSGWRKEILRFTGETAVDVQGSRVQRHALLQSDARFFVVHYHQVYGDHSLLAGEFAPDLLIVDEGQRVKNRDTQLAAKVKSIPARFVFVLTGTPVENRLADLYSLLQLVDPHVLGPLWCFEADHCTKDRHGKVVGYRGLSVLRERLQDVMLRRSRAIIADQLPERQYVDREVGMTEVQRELHDGALKVARRLLEILEERPMTPPEQQDLLAALQRARMAGNAAGLVDKKTVGSPKLSELRDLLEELTGFEGRKVVVFSEWEKMTAMAEQVAKGLGLGTVRLHGGVPVKNRAALIEKFQEDPATQVFFSTDAGGTGLNLQCATAVINLDLPWNPAVLDQRLARIHRLGQRRNVLMIMVLSADSYEMTVALNMGEKRRLFHDVIAEDGDDAVELAPSVFKQAVEALRAMQLGGKQRLPALKIRQRRGSVAVELLAAEVAPEVGPSLLAIQAQRKFKAAKALLEQEMADEALGLLCHALALELAERAHLDAVPDMPAVAWVFADLLPRGVVTGKEAGLVARTHGLAQAPLLPLGLAQCVFGEVQGMMG